MADHVIHISEAEAASDFAGLLAHVRAGVTVMVALRVGQIDGENQAKGVRLPLADLLIGVTSWNSATASPPAISATSR